MSGLRHPVSFYSISPESNHTPLAAYRAPLAAYRARLNLTFPIIEFILYYYGDFEKYHIFATNFSYKIMSNLLIISSFNLKL
jgi:hypothetical protein